MNSNFCLKVTVRHPDRRGFSTPSATRIWDTSRPLGLGHPTRWILSYSQNGIQLIDTQLSNDRELSPVRSTLLTAPTLTGEVHHALDDFREIHITRVSRPKRYQTLSADSAEHKAVDHWEKEFRRAPAARSSEDESFLKLQKQFAIALSVFLFSTVVVPGWLSGRNSADDETISQRAPIIPAQFAKVILQQKAAPPQTSQNTKLAKSSSSDAAPSANKNSASPRVRSRLASLLKGGLSRTPLAVGTANGAPNRNPSALNGSAVSEQLQSLAQQGASSAAAGMGKAQFGGDYAKTASKGITGQGQARIALNLAIPQVDEGLSKDEVGEVIHRHLSEVRYCYESAMIAQPNLEGKLVLHFTIASNGRVTTTRVDSSTLGERRVDDCIVRRLVTWQFPQPKGGTLVAVTYPFLFKTLGN